MRGMCPDGSIVAVKRGCVLGSEGQIRADGAGGVGGVVREPLAGRQLVGSRDGRMGSGQLRRGE